VRNTRSPAFLLVRTYRLKAHSKGDDDRDADEISYFEGCDPLNRLMELDWAGAPQAATRRRHDAHVAAAVKDKLAIERYTADQLPRRAGVRCAPVANDRIRMVQALNRAYRRRLEQNAVFLGEDIADPYGGAFKVSKGFSSDFPDRVFSTPISEGAIA